MVAGTYAVTGPTPLFNLGRIAEAQSSEELLREYAAKDSDTDGLPDWQEALYGTDPLNPESFQAGIKDGEAVAQGLIEPAVIVRAPGELTDPDTIPGTTALPNSVTDRFARAFFSQYLLSLDEESPSKEEVVSFVQNGVSELVATYEPKAAFSTGDMKTGGGAGAEAIRMYIIDIEQVLQSTGATSAEKSELYYFEDAMRGDESALKSIIDISGAYQVLSKSIQGTPVPREALKSHTDLANAFAQLAHVTEEMAALKSDPLRALLGIGSYRASADKLFLALENLGGVMDSYQIRPSEGEPGYIMYKMTHDLPRVGTR